jgi:hypothetical protein
MSLFEILLSAILFADIVLIIIMSLIFSKVNVKGTKTKTEPELSPLPISKVKNGSVCPECSQPTPNHLENCSLKKLEAKTNISKLRIPHCGICRQQGHYASKCPEKEKKPNELETKT